LQCVGSLLTITRCRQRSGVLTIRVSARSQSPVARSLPRWRRCRARGPRRRPLLLCHDHGEALTGHEGALEMDDEQASERDLDALLLPAGSSRAGPPATSLLLVQPSSAVMLPRARGRTTPFVRKASVVGRPLCHERTRQRERRRTIAFAQIRIYGFRTRGEVARCARRSYFPRRELAARSGATSGSATGRAESRSRRGLWWRDASGCGRVSCRPVSLRVGASCWLMGATINRRLLA
jgi:hypothetical protein